MADSSEDPSMPDDGPSIVLNPALKILINGLPSSATKPIPDADPIQAIKDQWLNSQYLTGADIDFRVRDFATVNAATHRHDSYWRDAHIDWALEFLRQKHDQHKDIRIVSTALAARLYSLSQRDSIPARSSREYRENWANDVVSLKERPILFVPVNDGYEQQYGFEVAETAQPNPASDGNPSSNAPAAKKPVKRPRSGGHGNHWSFVVLDMRDQKNYTARYIDGMVRLTRNQSGRLKMHNTNLNAPVAGRIVCALEKLLRIPEGSFQTSTLKFLPHMHRNDGYQGTDYGRCGPYLYAFMDHLLANKTSLVDPGLETTFNDPATMPARQNVFRFNSADIRAGFAEDLLRERRTQEAASSAWDADNLSFDRLRSIITPEVLAYLIESCKTPQVPRGGNAGRMSKKGGGGGGGSDDDDEDDDDDDDETKDKKNDSKETTQLRKKWREQLASGNPHGCDSFEAFVQMLAAQHSYDNDNTSSETTDASATPEPNNPPAFSKAMRGHVIDFTSNKSGRVGRISKSPGETSLSPAPSSSSTTTLALRPRPGAAACVGDAAAPKFPLKRRMSPRRTPSLPPAKKRRSAVRAGGEAALV